jgi:hypothetical protein
MANMLWLINEPIKKIENYLEKKNEKKTLEKDFFS